MVMVLVDQPATSVHVLPLLHKDDMRTLIVDFILLFIISLVVSWDSLFLQQYSI